MSAAQFGLAASVFLACAVEAVEALTIVLAVGTTRSWRWALAGVGVALFALSAIVVAAGPALASVSIGPLRVIVGGVLLLFGLHWLRKAVLRAAHLKALHDEGQIYRQQREAALGAEGRGREGFDRYCFSVAFQGVFVEGVEIVVIVLSFSASRGHLAMAAAAAGLAVVAVALCGVVARRPLTRVPENTMKLLVGVMLCAFGVFWSADGAGLRWPAGELALPLLAAAVLAVSLACVAWLRRGAVRASEDEALRRGAVRASEDEALLVGYRAAE